VQEVVTSLAELVELHAPSWNAPMLSEHGFLNRPGRVEALYGMAGPALPTFRERFSVRLDPAHMALAERLAPLSDRYPQVAWEPPFTLQHNDYRLDNLLFRQADERLQVSVIDWQALAVGPPLVDVAIHLTTSLTPAQRRAHQDELLRGYHATLQARGVGDFSLEDCMQCYRRASLHPFLVGVGASVMLAQSERGDAMFAALVGRSAELVLELGADSVLA
jgi:aminoglycoside phosphotransferase (APT) family kinase protein